MMATFDNINKMMNKVSDFLNLRETEKELLLRHEKISTAELSVNGKKFPAWRIIHNNARGPGKGGIRFHPEVSEDEVKSLSFWMSLKNSLADIPLGGAKGGVIVNPKKLTKKEIELLSRAYIRAFHDVLGADRDIPAPDVYTNPQIMAIMLDEFEKIKGRHEPGMITGKPLEVGGINLRGDATSKGGELVFKLLMKKLDLKKDDITIVIQGFGNAGMNMAKILYEDGFKITGISDSKGGIYNENGLNIGKSIELKENGEKLEDYEEAEKISNQELLELECDVLFLAALENQVTERNAGNVKAKYIVELANGPVNPEADEILFGKGIVVTPDILANSGGVIASYLEWANNRVGNVLEDDFMKIVFEKKLMNAFENTFELSNDNKVDMRTAAYIIAVKRILEAEKLRGRV